MSDPPRDESGGEESGAAKARRGRNLVIAWALGAFVAVVFIVTLVKLAANVAPA